MPAHARVNSRCYAQWNADKSDLDVVWDGAAYSHPFHAFAAQPDGGWDTCWGDGCVQRLFCTDSGAVGWYGRGGRPLDVPLAAAWLGHADTTHRAVLAAGAQHWTGAGGAGAVAVAGSALFFYTFAFADAPRPDALPRLSSLVFAPWRPGARGADLVREGLRACSVLGYGGSRVWGGWHAPLYPVGAGAVTLSVDEYHGGDAWALDAVLRDGARGPLVHYTRADCASVRSASREVATFPGLSCRALAAGGAQCARVGEGRWTWAGAEQRALDWDFAPLTGRFALPSALWLQADAVDGRAYRALVGFGHAPVLAYMGGALLLPETRADDSCDSGRAVVLARYRLGAGLEAQGATRLACAQPLAVPHAHATEASYAALALKWAPWAPGAVFVAADLAAGAYAGVAVDL